MPHREMRGRYLMREFWSDAEIQLDLTDSERWTLVGLWMLADDGGFLEWDLRYVASQLYNHEDRAQREKKVADHLERIVAVKKAKRFACGHVFLPAAANYGRPGRPTGGSHEVTEAHEAEPSRKSKKPSGKVSRTNGKLSERNALPNLTSPNLTSPHQDPTSSRKEPTRARPRGGALAPVGDEIGELKRKVGWQG